MSGFMDAARTNLTSTSCKVHVGREVGSGTFRDVVEGTYIGGNRNNQAAACKSFKPKFHHLEEEYYAMDFKVADKAIQFANEWNEFCPTGKEILINKGDLQDYGGQRYLVEPFIRDFEKYTSNSGTIIKHQGQGRSAETWAMEAFSHFTYHRSGGSLLICDLQGRYKKAKFANQKSRFELTDLACCSRRRLFGPTDLAEKGIDSFFANHVCNAFCHQGQSGRWSRPRNPVQWFADSTGTSMLSSRESHKLELTNPTKFTATLGQLVEEEEEEESEEDEDDVYSNRFGDDFFSISPHLLAPGRQYAASPRYAYFGKNA